MAREHAGKRSSGRGRKAPVRRGQAAPAKKLPIVPFLLVVVLICLFGYVLLSIQGASEQAAPAAPVVEQPQPKPEPKPQKPLPEAPPSNTWVYEKELPNKTVEVEVQERNDVVPQQLQCGSFRTQAQAETMKATIAFAGMESQVRRTEGSNGVWYRVVVGPLDSRRHGEAARHKLQRAGINTCQMWNWN
ncbi:SPOR domain-containing protein [Ferrimonas senticii]|uniref:SPOR domain-containing protein n=1 Tax=Ferrimonas senticii TaxID=394566 RepID=UPI000408C587|nr:SPOR domain-containing protein [Ferrimonas senticii]